MYSLIDGIRTGPRIQWPDGRRVAVMLTFDFEAETLRISNLARQGKRAGRKQDQRPLRRERGNLALSEDAGHLRRQGTFYPELLQARYPEEPPPPSIRPAITYHGILHEPGGITAARTNPLRWNRLSS